MTTPSLTPDERAVLEMLDEAVPYRMDALPHWKMADTILRLEERGLAKIKVGFPNMAIRTAAGTDALRGGGEI